MKPLLIISTSRADYGILRPVLGLAAARPALAHELVVAGARPSDAHDRMLDEIREDGLTAHHHVPLGAEAAGPSAVAGNLADAVAAFSHLFERLQPRGVFVTGDRFEMFAAATAATVHALPLLHLHGGERSEGAIDDALRHAITKMSHLHFASTTEAGRRIAQLGEEPWRIHVCGAPSLDNLRTLRPWDRGRLEAELGLSLDRPTLLVTLHPETTRWQETARQVRTLLETLGLGEGQCVFTGPNADTCSPIIREAIERAVRGRSDFRYRPHLGQAAYFGLMRHADAMVGNSSSGILEAPSFALPVVNIGDRQRGRLRATNVLDAPFCAHAIAEAVTRACDPRFREGLRGLPNPYGDGHAAERIVRVLAELRFDARLRQKHFVDWTPPEEGVPRAGSAGAAGTVRAELTSACSPQAHR